MDNKIAFMHFNPIQNDYIVTLMNVEDDAKANHYRKKIEKEPEIQSLKVENWPKDLKEEKFLLKKSSLRKKYGLKHPIIDELYGK